VIGEAPGILTVAQTARFLEAASSELLPYLAIGTSNHTDWQSTDVLRVDLIVAGYRCHLERKKWPLPEAQRQCRACFR
jgi:hypothetical protein